MYKQYFKKTRNGQDLCDKYRKIERNPDILQNYKNMAKSVINEENNSFNKTWHKSLESLKL
jgi:hypothetical protein